ncbi:BTB/POZ and MATH domain-containing protein 2-like [Triticum aestivum]|uniref:BTB/POZ and MATH domain-containing protein 2-like n=1 Tax=Triticum aestivum TaxID=4565 RepID=UPI001D012456|nr:BTB/POZ and MATH domain-containing protein 2-like [Triticum aestivum]
MASNSIASASHGQQLPKTTSRCLTPSFTATHDFEVTSYPLLQGIGVEKLVSSTVFSVGGFNWTISFFPDGVRHGSFGNASAFLNCFSPDKDVRARFTLNLLDKSGTQVTKFEEMEYIFTPKCVYRGYAQFIGKSWLKSWSDSNGSFIIRCVLTVIGESHSEVKRSRVLVPWPNLQGQLEGMRKKGEGADVTFSVCGNLFHAHRCLLAARSLVFKAELFGPMKEKATRSIKVEDIEPLVFEALLHFVYTDSMPDDEHSKDWNMAKLQHLLVAADRYGLDGLKALCESKLCECIDVETVATTLVLAEQHHCKDLQEACVEFMAPQNVLQAVMATDGFKHLVASCPLLMKDILHKISRTD